MKIIFILNPEANSGKCRNLISKIVEIMEKNHKAIYDVKICPNGYLPSGYKKVSIGNNNLRYCIVTSKSIGDAANIANNIKDNVDICVSVGGDGTLREVASSLIYSNCALGVIPAGTGNDFVRGMNWTNDLEEGIDRIINGKDFFIDSGFVDNEFFINVASIGFDAYVVQETNKIKHKLKSKISYKVAVLTALKNYVNQPMKLRYIDNEKGLVEEKRKFFLVAIGIGKLYGGGLPVLPNAVFNDGFFDGCIISDVNKFKVLSLLSKFIKGKHINIKNIVTMSRASEYSIIPMVDTLLNIDGDLKKINKGQELIFKIRPLSIKVRG